MRFPVAPLKHLAALPISNGVGEAAEFDDPTWPRYVRTTDIDGPRRLRDDTFRSLPPEVAQKAPLKAGDLVMTAAGGVGKSLLYGGAAPACYAGYLVRFRPRSGIDGRFVAYWAESQHYWDQVELGKVVSTIDNFSAGKYQNLRCPAPAEEVQRTIADYLDTETARIDALIEKKQTMIALLANRHRQLVRDFTLTSGEERPLRRVVTTVKTGTTPNTESEFLEDGFEWATPGDFTDGLQLQLTARRVSKEAVEAGEIPVFPSGSILVVGIGATAGRVALADRSVSSNQQVTAISPGSDVDRKFLAWQLWSRTDELRELAPYTTLPILNNEFLRSFVVKVPSLDVQLGIAQTLDLHWAKTAALQLRLRRQVELLHKHRQALITAAVTGEFEVPRVAA